MLCVKNRETVLNIKLQMYYTFMMTRVDDGKQLIFS